jgi:dipeptidyl aminopeptidase/acylaminoacyl peptidase
LVRVFEMAEKEGKRAFTVDDVAKIKTIESVATSPDGGRALYVLRSMNLDENRFDNDIYLVPTSGGESLRLTEDGKSSLPAWSPDGRKIAYVQGVEEGKRIWLMDPEGKNRRKVADYQISNASLGVSTVGEAVLWSPDGSRLAFLATLEPHDKDAKIRVVDRIMYKAFYGYSDMRRRHVFVASPLGSEPPRQLTFGDFDEYSMAWSPDGKEIAFVSNRTGRADHNMHLDIYAVEVESGETRRITESVGAEYYPAWSPDGRMIAYTATTRGNTSNESTPEDRHVWVVGSDGDDPRDLTLDFDRACNGPLQWTPNGGRILFTAYDRGRAPICSVSPEGGEVTKVTDSDRFYGNLSLAREGGRMVYTSNDPTRPDELYSSDLDGGNEVRLTDHNCFLDGVHLDWPEEFGFKTADGLDIQGWIYKPMGFDPSGKHPALLNIKGGPSGMRGYGFNVHLQLLPAYGYVQFIVNYRGSSGYGQAFSDAVVGDMLGGEYRDNLEALDHVIETRDYIDADRMGVWGVSYGGYLTNWIVTQTDRFRAAVSISSVSNLFSQWGASAIPSWVEVEIGGLPWERMDLMLRQSPIMQADKVRTPVLFLHGELDFDTPIVEAEQMFMALKKHGVEAVMVRYADDGHGIRRKPANQLDSMRRVIAWFNGHLKGKVGSV